MPKKKLEAEAKVTKGARTRSLIKDAIKSLAMRTEWSEITLSDICAATGLTAGAFYFHFNTKDEAIAELAVDLLGSAFEELSQSISSKDGVYETAHAVLTFYYVWYLKEPHTSSFIYSVTQSREDVYRVWLERRAPIRKRLQDVFTTAREAAGLPSGEEEFLSHWLLSGVEDFLLDVFFSKGNDELAALAGNADTFIRVQANAWFRSVMGQEPDHSLSRRGRAAVSGRAVHVRPRVRTRE